MIDKKHEIERLNKQAGIPVEYSRYTDYRNIPRQYLNSKIPEGRAMIKWMPFATTPELYKDIEQQIKDQVKIELPTLSDDQLMELNIVLSVYMNKPTSVIIKYYEAGYINLYDCVIEKLDHMNKLITVYDCKTKERKQFEVDCIMGIGE